MPHGKGVLSIGVRNRGAGLRRAKKGDRYEGEFYFGFAHGVGMRTNANGRVYRGGYSEGLPDGCGLEYSLAPFNKEVRALAGSLSCASARLVCTRDAQTP